MPAWFATGTGSAYQQQSSIEDLRACIPSTLGSSVTYQEGDHAWHCLSPVDQTAYQAYYDGTNGAYANAYDANTQIDFAHDTGSVEYEM